MKPDIIFYDWTDKTIIIADNSELSHQFTSALLKETNCTQIWFKNGADLIKYCQENDSISLILIEEKLPIFNGIEATAIIKRLKPEIPIIAYTISYNKNAFLKAGCDVYFFKPVCIDIIYSTINSFFEKKIEICSDF